MTCLLPLSRASLMATCALGTLTLLLGIPPAHADVTIQQQTTMSLAGINIDVTDVERTSADKQRSDSTMHCHGLLALVCRNEQSSEIRRLDKQLEWDLEPKKQLCTERDFPTPEQRAKAQLAFESTMAQMKTCPMPQQSAQAGPDTSRCQMSAAKIDVQQSGEHQTLIGHDAHRSTVVMSQTCTDSQTGQVCQFDYGFDLWLTPDDLPGLAERRDFAAKFAAAQGLDPNNPQLRGMMQQFMAPYADSLRQLQTQGASLQGNALRTTFFMDYGGPQCGNTQQQQQQQAQQQAPRRRGGLFGSIASNAVGSSVSGFFHHSVSVPSGSVAGQVASNAANQTADAAASAAANATANGVADASAAHSRDTSASATGGAAPATPPGMVRMVSFTTEVTSIDTASIDASQFDLPAGYHVQPPAPPSDTKQPICPANAH